MYLLDFFKINTRLKLEWRRLMIDVSIDGVVKIGKSGSPKAGYLVFNSMKCNNPQSKDGKHFTAVDLRKPLNEYCFMCGLNREFKFFINGKNYKVIKTSNRQGAPFYEMFSLYEWINGFYDEIKHPTSKMKFLLKVKKLIDT